MEELHYKVLEYAYEKHSNPDSEVRLKTGGAYDFFVANIANDFGHSNKDTVLDILEDLEDYGYMEIDDPFHRDRGIGPPLYFRITQKGIDEIEGG